LGFLQDRGALLLSSFSRGTTYEAISDWLSILIVDPLDQLPYVFLSVHGDDNAVTLLKVLHYPFNDQVVALLMFGQKVHAVAESCLTLVRRLGLNKLHGVYIDVSLELWHLDQCGNITHDLLNDANLPILPVHCPSSPNTNLGVKFVQHFGVTESTSTMHFVDENRTVVLVQQLQELLALRAEERLVRTHDNLKVLEVLGLLTETVELLLVLLLQVR